MKDEGNELKNELIEEIMSKKEAIKVANQVLNEITSDEQMRERIRSIELARLDQISREHYARLEGREEGEKRTFEIITAIKAGKSELEIISEFNITKEWLQEIKNLIS